MSETVLWTNSSPSSSYAGATITLSSIASYSYIKIYYRKSTSDSTERSVIYTLSDARNSFDTSNGDCVMIICVRGGELQTRRIRYISDTSFDITACRPINTASGLNNNYAIPTKICGCN